MTTPWLVNLWGCNVWEKEPDRAVATDQESYGGSWFQTVAATAPTPLPPDDLPSAAAHARDLIATWPTVAPVISEALHVTERLDPDILKFVNSRLAPGQQPRTHLECFHRAVYQLHLAKFGQTGPPISNPRNFQLVVEMIPNSLDERYDVIDVAATLGAVLYLHEALSQGIPVLLGIRLTLFKERPNDKSATPDRVEPTNHFVVAVGLGQDEHGSYVSYYDYQHSPSPDDRFYLNETLSLTDRSGTAPAQDAAPSLPPEIRPPAQGYRTLIEVRRSVRER